MCKENGPYPCYVWQRNLERGVTMASLGIYYHGHFFGVAKCMKG